MISLDFYNRLTLSVAVGPRPDSAPSVSFDLIIDEPDAGLGRDDLEALRALARDLTLTPDRVPAPHTLGTRDSQMSWGASGGAAEVLLYVAEGALAMTVEEMIRRVVVGTQAIRRGPVVALEEGTADSAARQAIALRYPVKASDLQRHGESVTGDSTMWTLTYRTVTDEYEVQVRSVEGFASLTSVRRTTLPD